MCGVLTRNFEFAKKNWKSILGKIVFKAWTKWFGIEIKLV